MLAYRAMNLEYTSAATMLSLSMSDPPQWIVSSQIVSQVSCQPLDASCLFTMRKQPMHHLYHGHFIHDFNTSEADSADNAVGA